MNRRLATIALAATAVAGLAAAPAGAHVPAFRNCTAMHQVYPHGVGRPGAHDHVRGHSAPVTTWKVSAAIYLANTRLDRDGDGIACEKR